MVTNLNNRGFTPSQRACGKDKEISGIACDSSWGRPDSH